ncbi:SRPBCC domain-containing protein [Mycena kentingensis (nom. inval.)]|nr:SRPBCC domain-containing protein [Mycena kentingensis (nom. inval.)]
MAHHLIPVESDWPILIRESVTIAAPRDKVWDVFTDFTAYPEWNPHWRSCTLLDAKKNPLPAGIPIATGHHLQLKIHLPPTLEDSVPTRTLTELLSDVSLGSYISWGARRMPFLFRTSRLYLLTDVELEGGGQGTKMEAFSAVGGVLGALFPARMQWDLRMGIKEMNEALKTRCEQT